MFKWWNMFLGIIIAIEYVLWVSPRTHYPGEISCPKQPFLLFFCKKIYITLLWYIFCMLMRLFIKFHKCKGYTWINIHLYVFVHRDGQNHHTLMILKSKSNHLNKGDLKSKSKSF